MLKWMMRIKRTEKNIREEIRAMKVVENISEKIREARLRWLGYVERKTKEDVATRTWKTKTEVERCYTKRYDNERERSTER